MPSDRPLKIAKLIPSLRPEEYRRVSTRLNWEERAIADALRAKPTRSRTELLRRGALSTRRLNLLTHSIWRKVVSECAPDGEEGVTRFLAEHRMYDEVVPQLRRSERQLLEAGATAERMAEFYERASSIVFEKLPASMVDHRVLLGFARKFEAVQRTGATDLGLDVFLHAIVTQAMSPYTELGGTLDAKRKHTLRTLEAAYDLFRESHDRRNEARFSFLYAYNLILADKLSPLVVALIERIGEISNEVGGDASLEDYRTILLSLRHASRGEHERALEVCSRANTSPHIADTSSGVELVRCDSLLALGRDDEFVHRASKLERRLAKQGRDIGSLFRVRLLLVQHAILHNEPREVEAALSSLSNAHHQLPQVNFSQEWLFRSILPFARFPGMREPTRALREADATIRWLARRGMRSEHPQTLALQGLQSILSHAHERDVVERKALLYDDKLCRCYGTHTAVLRRLLAHCCDALTTQRPVR